MEQSYAGIVAVPLISGLIEGFKRAGLENKWAFPLSITLGLSLSLAFSWANGAVLPKDWLDSGIIGLGLGLSASGLYSGTKDAVERLKP
jgi:hypothetical protein